MAKADENEQGTPEDEGTEDAGDGSEGAVLTLTPDAVRNSPEFIALAKENRKLARQKGSAEMAAEAARRDAQAARQAAEATQLAAQEEAVRSILGAEGVAQWNEIAELSQTDEQAAARKFAELMAGARAQSPANDTAPAAGEAPAGGEGTVEGLPPTTAPPPSRGVDGGQPLGAASTGEDVDALVGQLTTEYQATADRVQKREKVKLREVGDALMKYLGGSYLQHPRIRAIVAERKR